MERESIESLGQSVKMDDARRGRSLWLSLLSLFTQVSLVSESIISRECNLLSDIELLSAFFPTSSTATSSAHRLATYDLPYSIELYCHHCSIVIQLSLIPLPVLIL